METERLLKRVSDSKTEHVEIVLLEHLNGYNRLFGDGSVRWAKPGPLTRQVTAAAPSPVRQMQYYQELDTLP